MTIYNLYIFDATCTCIYYGEWNRENESSMSQDQEFKLIYGMLLSFQSVISRISPFDNKEKLVNIQTDKYRMNCFESPTGVKFVLNTDLDSTITSKEIQEILKEFYKNIYVQYSVRNSQCKAGKPIESKLFKKKANEFIVNSSIYKSV